VSETVMLDEAKKHCSYSKLSNQIKSDLLKAEGPDGH